MPECKVLVTFTRIAPLGFTPHPRTRYATTIGTTLEASLASCAVSGQLTQAKAQSWWVPHKAEKALAEESVDRSVRSSLSIDLDDRV